MTYTREQLEAMSYEQLSKIFESLQQVKKMPKGMADTSEDKPKEDKLSKTRMEMEDPSEGDSSSESDKDSEDKEDKDSKNKEGKGSSEDKEGKDSKNATSIIGRIIQLEDKSYGKVTAEFENEDVEYEPISIEEAKALNAKLPSTESVAPKGSYTILDLEEEDTTDEDTTASDNKSDNDKSSGNKASDKVDQNKSAEDDDEYEDVEDDGTPQPTLKEILDDQKSISDGDPLLEGPDDEPIKPVVPSISTFMGWVFNRVGNAIDTYNRRESYTRPNRRRVGQPGYGAPGTPLFKGTISSVLTPKVIFYLDTSGSMEDHLDDIYADFKRGIKSFPGAQYELWGFTTICKDGHIVPYFVKLPTDYGGSIVRLMKLGGTNINSVFRKINDTTADYYVVITDAEDSNLDLTIVRKHTAFVTSNRYTVNTNQSLVDFLYTNF